MPAIVIAVLILASGGQPQVPAQPFEPDVVAQSRKILAAAAAGDFAAIEAQFTPEMKAALPPGRFAAMWNGLRQAGAFKSCAENPRVRNIADKVMVITLCEFERAAFDVQFAFDSAGRISGLTFRPGTAAPAPSALPPYARPGSYTDTAMTIGSSEWALPATLTMPTGTALVPAVVLVHGSGPHDRDSTVGANRPFRDLATGLASRGIAVLRYAKRTQVHGAKMTALKTYTVREEVIDDVIIAVRTLRVQPRIDTGRIFVLGHSLGGTLLPRIAAADSTIAGLIALAGSATPLEEAIVAQSRYLALADGTISKEEQIGIDRAAALRERVRALTTEDAASGRVLAGAPASYWLDLRGYDPPAVARLVKPRMLWLQGERDYQVTADDFSKWKAALGSRRDVTFRSYPALNHLFIAGTGSSLPAEYQVPGHVAEDVIRDIASWILG
ncbi:MAG: alpha/beta fold hydrolase [Vicinamibacterales bacterium]